MNCPTCKGPSVKAGNKVYPFCRERCQLVDLGRWISEDYRVPGEPVDPTQIPHGDTADEQLSSHAGSPTQPGQIQFATSWRVNSVRAGTWRFGAVVMALAAGSVAGATHTAQADPIEIGGWLGGRGFSDNSLLGYKADASQHPMLSNGVVFGARIARPIIPYIVPELELALSPTKTAGFDATVLWLSPRAHIRFELMPRKQVRPFLLIGGGSPIALSTKRGIFDSGIVGDGYVGGGIEFTTERGFDLRFDFRGSLMPGVDPVFTLEWDAGLGLSFRLGEAARRRRAATKLVVPVNLDPDNDGIFGSDDKCPDRAEDIDGFEDHDGCPDIDNDLDSVLDIADKCPLVPETYNGFADDDGCPDVVPTELEAVVGTVEGLIYGAQETEVRDSAGASLDRIAALLTKYPSVRIVLIGHTDETEATPKGTPDVDAPPDIDELSEDLGLARAESVRQGLMSRGIAAVRIETLGAGRSELVADNATPRGRLANRRVELKLYVPKR